MKTTFMNTFFLVGNMLFYVEINMVEVMFGRHESFVNFHLGSQRVKTINSFWLDK